MGPQLRADLNRSASPAALASGAIELVPARLIADELHITRRTLSNWVVNPAVGFPAPYIINERWFFGRQEIESWKLARIRKSVGSNALRTSQYTEARDQA
jgi:hypothetical protein